MYIVGNWKMNTTPAESNKLAQEIIELTKNLDVNVWAAPPTTSLAALIETCKGTNLKIGSQNVHWENSGAYTGEVSTQMLQELGADFVIVGHSERRQFFAETNETAAQRAQAALNAGMTTIFCIGETAEQRSAGSTNQVLDEQLTPLLSDGLNTDKLLVAYEPVWAIGTGNAAEPKDIEEVHNYIKSWFSAKDLAEPPILYGGSVKPSNFDSISSIDSVNGALIGGASLNAESFAGIAEIGAKA